jgi:hypothetical protein
MVVVLFSISASLGIVIGLLVLPPLTVCFASLTVVALSLSILLDDGFGVYSGALISVACLTTVQVTYLVGVSSLSWKSRCAASVGWLSAWTRSFNEPS